MRIVGTSLALLPLVIVSSVGGTGCSDSSTSDADADAGAAAPPPGYYGGKGQYPPSGPPVQDTTGCDGSPRLALTLDGVACEVQSARVLTNLDPGGHGWSVEIIAACPSLPFVVVKIQSNDDATYPQSCANSTSVALVANADAGPSTSYGAGGASGSCTIESGPVVANGSAPLSLTATVVSDDAGATHVVSIVPASQAPLASPPAPLRIDGVDCTGTSAPMFTPPTPTDTRWVLVVGGRCGAYRTSDLWVSSRADIPYPQPCSPATQVSLELNSNQPCQKSLSTVNCTVTAGPSLATGSALVPVRVSVVDTTGRVYNAVFTPP
jgi:hypothetical protein